MLLRRMIEHVKAQNWTAVALDFVIVVMGVFIGIQVANWNAARADRVQERVILSNIIDDLRSDELWLDEGIRMADVNIRAGNYALEKAGFAPVNSISLAVNNTNLTQSVLTAAEHAPLTAAESRRLWNDLVVRYHPSQSATSFQTLMATGNLGIIRDRDLIRDLQTYNRSWIDLESSHVGTLKPFRDHAVFVGQKFGLSPFTQMPAEEFVSLLKEQPELRGTVRTMVEYSLIHRDIQTKLKATTRALLERLGAGETQ